MIEQKASRSTNWKSGRTNAPEHFRNTTEDPIAWSWWGIYYRKSRWRICLWNRTSLCWELTFYCENTRLIYSVTEVRFQKYILFLIKSSKGYDYVLCMLLESPARAFEELEKSIFQGRLLDVMPSKQPPPASEKLPTKGTAAAGMNTFKQNGKITRSHRKPAVIKSMEFAVHAPWHDSRGCCKDLASGKYKNEEKQSCITHKEIALQYLRSRSGAEFQRGGSWGIAPYPLPPPSGSQYHQEPPCNRLPTLGGTVWKPGFAALHTGSMSEVLESCGRQVL